MLCPPHTFSTRQCVFRHMLWVIISRRVSFMLAETICAVRMCVLSKQTAFWGKAPTVVSLFVGCLYAVCLRYESDVCSGCSNLWIIVKRSSVVCVAGVLANKSSSVSSAMWRTVFSLAAKSSERDREILLKCIFCKLHIFCSTHHVCTFLLALQLFYQSQYS